MVTYFHTDLVQYFFHTLACPLHWIAPVAGVILLLLIQSRRSRRNGRFGLSGGASFYLLLGTVFVLLYLTDVPAVFARCPVVGGVKPSATVSSGNLPGLLLGISAGLATFLSPCGLPPLPAYINYFLGAKPSRERAISLAFLSTSGFIFSLGVFTVVFLLLRNYLVQNVPAAAFVKGLFPSATNVSLQSEIFDILGYVAGAIAIFMGLLIVFRVRLPFFQARSLGKVDRSVRSVFLFSLGWGTSSIACSPYAIIPFLLYALTKGGISPFFGFGLGFAVPVLLISLLLGVGKGPLVEKIARASARIHRYTGLLLMITGIVVVIYTFLFPSTIPASFTFG